MYTILKMFAPTSYFDVCNDRDTDLMGWISVRCLVNCLKYPSRKLIWNSSPTELIASILDRLRHTTVVIHKSGHPSIRLRLLLGCSVSKIGILRSNPVFIFFKVNAILLDSTKNVRVSIVMGFIEIVDVTSDAVRCTIFIVCAVGCFVSIPKLPLIYECQYSVWIW